MISRLILLGFLGAIAGFALWVGGLGVASAIAWGILTAAGGMLLFIRARTPSGLWYSVPEDPPKGTRDDVSRLSWALRSPRVSDAALIRVRRLTAVRLDRHRADGADPADTTQLAALLDNDNPRSLARASGVSATRRQLESALDRLDDLDAQEKQ